MSIDARRWLRVLALGVLWGVAVSAMDVVTLPTDEGYGPGYWAFTAWIIPGWSIVGIAIALLVELAGARCQRPAFFAVAIAGCALGFSAVWSGIYAVANALELSPGMPTLFPTGAEPISAFLYQAWTIAFYGGLYLAAWTLNHRAERTRHALENARIARMQTEVLLGDAQLQTLRGHLDPGFLLRVMTEVERRYVRMPEQADRLIGHLVAFLRLAMPGVRSGESTLAAELRLACAYAALWADLDPGRATWTIRAPEPPPDCAFPPLLLLPLLDRLAATSRAAARGQLTVAIEGSAIALSFDGGDGQVPDWLGPELAYRLRVGLSTLFGARWRMTQGGSMKTGAPLLGLTIFQEQGDRVAASTWPNPVCIA